MPPKEFEQFYNFFLNIVVVGLEKKSVWLGCLNILWITVLPVLVPILCKIMLVPSEMTSNGAGLFSRYILVLVK